MSIVIVDHRASWADEFAVVGAALRAALGDRAQAIHHIGSTSVPGLAAKDVIDVQVTVDALTDDLRSLVEGAGLGLFWLDDIDGDHTPPGTTVAAAEVAKRIAAARTPHRRVNLHLRVAGRWNHRYALLCRDFLRADRAAAAAYCEVKRQLARHLPDDVEAYDDVKDPVVDILMAGAERWATGTEWTIPPGDA